VYLKGVNFKATEANRVKVEAIYHCYLSLMYGMKQLPMPENEATRLEALARYEILDTPEEAEFDDLTRIAACICGTPIALIGLVDADRLWFKSKVGWEVSETPRLTAFCARTILQPDPLIVPNTLEDERFATHPLVTGDANIRFYASAPLITSDGCALGSLCALDRTPRSLSPEQIEALQALSRQVVRLIETRRCAGTLQRAALQHQAANKKRRGFYKQIVAGFGLAAAILAAVGWVSYRSLTDQIETSRQSIQSKNLSEKFDTILSEMEAAESGQRGYLLTGNDRYLESYNATVRDVASQVKELRQLTANRPEYQRQIDTLEPLISAHLYLIKETVELRQNEGFAAALEAIKINRGQSLMNYIRATLGSMKNSENHLSQVRSAAAEASSRNTVAIFSGGLFASFLVLAAVYYFIYREISLRYRTERGLELERDFTTAIFETVGTLVMVLDSQGRIIRFNRAGERVTGYPFFEVAGKVFWEFFSIPAELEQIKTAFLKLQENLHAVNNYENNWAVRDGSTKLISWTTASLRKLDNTLEYAIVTGTDITASKRAEQRQSVQHSITRILAESATVEKALQNSIKAICHALKWDLGELWMPEGAELMQHNNTDFTNFPSLICTNFWSNPSLELPEYMAEIGLFTFKVGVGLPGRIWETGWPYWISDISSVTHFKVRDSLCKDGMRGALGFPILDRGNVCGVLVFYSRYVQQKDRDLLEKMANIGSQIGQFIRRKQADLELKNIQERLQAIMDNSSTLIFIKDAGGCFQFVNRKFERLFNITSERIQGKTDRDLFPPKIADTFRQNDLKVLCSGIPLEIEETVVQDDGLHTYLSVKFPLLDPVSDRFNAVCGIATDITDRKAAEIALQKQQAALIELAQCQQLYIGDLAAAWREITETAARTLGVERASVWLYNRDRSLIRCVDLYEASKNCHAVGLKCAAVDYPRYFEALETENVLAVDDTQNDTRTLEFLPSYFAPLGIRSMLDVPVRVAGQTVGVLRYESTRKPRQWRLEEQNFASYLGYMAALAMEAHERQQVQKALHAEQEKVERLLLNILPPSIASRLKQEQSSIADSFAEATVLFADIVGFTKIADFMSPTELVYLLNEIFSSFDLLTETHGLEKIKTIGDAYMVAGGIPVKRADSAEAIALLALDMQRAIERFNKQHCQNFNIRIGINTGPVVAGVIGIKKFIYDLWGDTVNTASRMESHGLPGQIHLTEATYQLLVNKFVFKERGTIDIKGKGLMRTYFLTGRKSSSIDFLR
jgi:PAS domain S-box-containing protein